MAGRVLSSALNPGSMGREAEARAAQPPPSPDYRGACVGGRVCIFSASSPVQAREQKSQVRVSSPEASPKSSNLPITWAPTRTLVRTKPSSNVSLRVHARAPLVRTDLEFERFDHVGSQNLSDPAFELLLTAAFERRFLLHASPRILRLDDRQQLRAFRSHGRSAERAAAEATGPSVPACVLQQV